MPWRYFEEFNAYGYEWPVGNILIAFMIFFLVMMYVVSGTNIVYQKRDGNTDG